MLNFIATLIKSKSGKSTLLIHLDELFPECKKFNAEQSTPRLSCYRDTHHCPVSSINVCFTILVERVYRLFPYIPGLEVILLHWVDKNERRFGAVFYKDDSRDIEIKVLNKWALSRLESKIGKRFSIEMSA